MSAKSIRKPKFEHQYENVYTSLLFCAGWLFCRCFVHRFGQQREPSGLYAVLDSFSATHRK